MIDIDTTDRNKKLEDLHWDAQEWKSKFQLVRDEINFIENLLNSYVFEPNTPNLFEKLQGYKERLQKTIKKIARVEKGIQKHESDLGGLLECKDASCDLSFYQSHDLLELEVMGSLGNFQKLKHEIFNYAGGVLKKRKPVV